jgi:hypothetical protein
LRRQRVAQPGWLRRLDGITKAVKAILTHGVVAGQSGWDMTPQRTQARRGGAMLACICPNRRANSLQIPGRGELGSCQASAKQNRNGPGSDDNNGKTRQSDYEKPSAYPFCHLDLREAQYASRTILVNDAWVPGVLFMPSVRRMADPLPVLSDPDGCVTEVKPRQTSEGHHRD